MKNKLLSKPKNVIERWSRFNTYKKLKKLAPYLERILLFKLRIELKFKNSKKTKVIESALKAVIKEQERIDKNKFPNLAKLFNFSAYILLAERDIQSMHTDAFTHKNPVKRNLSLRIMILTIHERDLSKVLNAKELQEIYDDSSISKDLREKLVNAFRQMSKAQKKANFRFKDIRNISIAHRDKDAYLQYNTIENIKILEMANILEEYYSASRTLIEVMPLLIEEASSTKSLMKQYFKNEN